MDSIVNGRGLATSERIRCEGSSLYVNPRQVVHEAGDWGKAWRVLSGAVRLDLMVNGQESFAGIALAGDTLGGEVAEIGEYAFTARALVPSTLVSLPPPSDGAAWRWELGGAIAQQKRMASMLALRCGSADERVVRLLGMLAVTNSFQTEDRGNPMVCLPFLRDMAEITDLTTESVSRSITKLRKQGVLQYIQASKKVVRLDQARFFRPDDTLTQCA